MTSTDRRTRSGLFWALALILVVAAVYTGGWLLLAHFAETKARTAIASLNRDGHSAECAGLSFDGFPWTFGARCASVSYTDPARGISASAGPLRASVPVYDPFLLAVAPSAPASFAAPGLGSVELDWRSLGVVTSLGLDRVSVITFTGQDLGARRTAGGNDAGPLFTAAAASAAARAIGDDLAIAGDFDTLDFGEAVPKLKGLPPLSGEADLTLGGGAALLKGSRPSLRNRSLAIRRLALAPGKETDATLSGQLAFDPEGRADGTLHLSIRNPKALSDILGAAFPQSASQIATGLGMLASLGPHPTVPLAVSKGSVYMGLFKLGTLPPVR